MAVVDEFAHTNVPGSEHLKRWQDVHVLLEAGIDVLTSMNVQHLESLNDQVWHSTGVRVRETVPDWVVDEADEVVLIDPTPRALRNRLERGVVYTEEKAQRALGNFFSEANLTRCATAPNSCDRLFGPPCAAPGPAGPSYWLSNQRPSSDGIAPAFPLLALAIPIAGRAAKDHPRRSGI